MDAFWSLYCNKRIEKITVKDITQKAGYNRGTFYEYFKDVYDVLEQVEQSVIPSIDEFPPITINETTIGTSLDIYLQLFQRKSKYYSVLLGDQGDPAFLSKLKGSIKPLLGKTLAINHDLNSVEMDFFLEYVLSGMIGILCYWFKTDMRMPAEDLIILMHRLTEDGVLMHSAK